MTGEIIVSRKVKVVFPAVQNFLCTNQDASFKKLPFVHCTLNVYHNNEQITI